MALNTATRPQGSILWRYQPSTIFHCPPSATKAALFVGPSFASSSYGEGGSSGCLRCMFFSFSLNLFFFLGFVCLICRCLCSHWFLVRLGSFTLWVVVFLSSGVLRSRKLSDSNASLLFLSAKPSASTPSNCTFLSFLKKNRCDSRIMFGLGGMPPNIQQP